MIKDSMYEGELIIQNVNPEIKKYIINAIKNRGEKGLKRFSG